MKNPNLFRFSLQGQNDRISERLGNASRRAVASRPACRIHFKNRDTTREVALKPFDERLFQLKLQPMNQQMHAEAGKCWARARAEVKRLGNHARLLPAFVECQLEVLRKYLEEIYRLRREVWLLDGNAVTPEFIRNILVPHAFTVIAARKGAIQGELNRHATRTGEHQRGGHILAHQMNRLQSEVANRCEVDAIELAKQSARKIPATSPNSLALGAQSQSEVGRTVENSNFPSANAEIWGDFCEKYQTLAREEQGRTVAITKGEILGRMDQLLRATCDYTKHPEGWERGKPEQGLICLLDTPPHGVWNYASDGLSENFRERVRLCVVKSGIALGCPKGTDPEDFWLHYLYRDLLANNSDLLFAASEVGGMILSVCVASATFCSRLENKSLRQTEPDTRKVETFQSMDQPMERVIAVANVLMPDAGLLELGLLDFSLHRLEKVPDERLLELLKQAEDQHSWLRQAVRQGQIDPDLERIAVMCKQLTKELARRGKLPSPAQNVRETDSSKSKSTPVGRNINMLRKECGWSFDDLVDETGIDKKSILAHVNEGRKPRPRTLKEYAQAFSKALQKEVTVADLEK
jgi:DNA-binding XRE family transcriptional regulator